VFRAAREEANDDIEVPENYPEKHTARPRKRRGIFISDNNLMKENMLAKPRGDTPVRAGQAQCDDLPLDPIGRRRAATAWRARRYARLKPSA
jgi:hypothetical protein